MMEKTVTIVKKEKSCYYKIMPFDELLAEKSPTTPDLTVSEKGPFPDNRIFSLTSEDLKTLGKEWTEKWLPLLKKFWQERFKSDNTPFSNLTNSEMLPGRLAFRVEDGEIKTMVTCAPFIYEGKPIPGLHYLSNLASFHPQRPAEEVVLEVLADVPDEDYVIVSVDTRNPRRCGILMENYLRVGFNDYYNICSENDKNEWERLNKHPLYIQEAELREKLREGERHQLEKPEGGEENGWR